MFEGVNLSELAPVIALAVIDAIFFYAVFKLFLRMHDGVQLRWQDVFSVQTESLKGCEERLELARREVAEGSRERQEIRAALVRIETGMAS